MTRIARALLTAALTYAFAGIAPAAPDGDPLRSLAWLAGSWAGEEGGRSTEEHWIAPRGGLMLGVHREVAGGKAVSFEFLRIEARAGVVVYVASPEGAPPTEFRLVQSGPSRAVFENLRHDFPVRILYWLTTDGSLHARIEGPGEKPRAFEWVWRRAAGASK